MSRAAARLIATFASLAIGASLLVGGGAASAIEGEGFTLPARGSYEGDYGPIPAPDPASVTANGTVTPEECAVMPSCMVVPVDIEVPDDLAPADDFYAIFTMAFDAPTGAEDLDTFLYDDGQTAEQEGTTGPTEVGSSASGDNPEVIKAFDPRLGRYNLVLVNFTGAGIMVHLKAESIVSAFDKPFESLAPGPNNGTVNRNNKPTTTTTRPAPTAVASTTTTVTVPSGVVIPDDDFEGGAFAPEENEFDVGQLDELTAAAEGIDLRREAESPSALAVIGWMVLMPLALVGAALLLLKRNRRRGRREPDAAAVA